MTAANLLELAACDGVQIRFAPSGNLKASGPSDAQAIWLPELKALKPAIAAVAARVNNAAHRCDAYGQLAPISVSARICGRVRKGDGFARRIVRKWRGKRD